MIESEISRQITATINSTLNSCIQVKETRISRRATIPDQVYFCLNSNLIKQIEWVQENNHKLILSSSNLASLRYYALVNAPLEEVGLISSCPSTPLSFWQQRSPLTFTTNYLFSHSQQPCTLFRSFVDLEGKISQQVHQDLYQNPQLLPRISQAHYWLVLEILAQLPLKPKSQYLWSAWGLFLVSTSIISLLLNYHFYLNTLLNLAISIFIIITIKIFFTKIIFQQLKPLVIYHLRGGLLGKSIRSRQIGLQILNFII